MGIAKASGNQQIEQAEQQQRREHAVLRRAGHAFEKNQLEHAEPARRIGGQRGGKGKDEHRQHDQKAGIAASGSKAK